MNSTSRERIRLKCRYEGEIRTVVLSPHSTIADLKRRLAADFGFEVTLKYEDKDHDWITLSSQHDLSDLFLIEGDGDTVNVFVSESSALPQLKSIGRTNSGGGVGGSGGGTGSYHPILSASRDYSAPPTNMRTTHQHQHPSASSISSSQSLFPRFGAPASNVGKFDRFPNINEPSSSYYHNSIRWKKAEMLGQGAFGVVYLGLNIDTGELMAVKQMATEEVSKRELSSLENEINLLRNLRHPNIVRYIGTELTATSLSIFLEYVPGGSLKALIDKFGHLEESVAKSYTRQLLLGLEYLHRNGIAHRDIKGANCLVGNDGVIKLADFGNSKHWRPTSPTPPGIPATQTGDIKGTPAWIAPEVVRDQGQNISWRKADIWSLGCTTLEMTTGRPPWSQFNNSVTILYNLACQETLPDYPSPASTELLTFLNVCFQRNPQLRPDITSLLLHPFVSNIGASGNWGGNLIRPSTVSSVTHTETDSASNNIRHSVNHWNSNVRRQSSEERSDIPPSIPLIVRNIHSQSKQPGCYTVRPLLSQSQEPGVVIDYGIPATARSLTSTNTPNTIASNDNHSMSNIIATSNTAEDETPRTYMLPMQAQNFDEEYSLSTVPGNPESTHEAIDGGRDSPNDGYLSDFTAVSMDENQPDSSHGHGRKNLQLPSIDFPHTGALSLIPPSSALDQLRSLDPISLPSELNCDPNQVRQMIPALQRRKPPTKRVRQKRSAKATVINSRGRNTLSSNNDDNSSAITKERDHFAASRNRWNYDSDDGSISLQNPLQNKNILIAEQELVEQQGLLGIEDELIVVRNQPIIGRAIVGISNFGVAGEDLSYRNPWESFDKNETATPNANITVPSNQSSPARATKQLSSNSGYQQDQTSMGKFGVDRQPRLIEDSNDQLRISSKGSTKIDAITKEPGGNEAVSSVRGGRGASTKHQQSQSTSLARYPESGNSSPVTQSKSLKSRKADRGFQFPQQKEYFEASNLNGNELMELSCDSLESLHISGVNTLLAAQSIKPATAAPNAENSSNSLMKRLPASFVLDDHYGNDLHQDNEEIEEELYDASDVPMSQLGDKNILSVDPISLDEHTGSITRLKIPKRTNNSLLLSSSTDGTVRIWASGETRSRVVLDVNTFLLTSAPKQESLLSEVRPERKITLGSKVEESVTVSELPPELIPAHPPSAASTRGLKVLQMWCEENCDSVWASCNDSHIRVWGGMEGRPLRLLKGHEENITCLEGLDPSSYYAASSFYSTSSHSSSVLMASGSSDRTIRIWDLRAKKTQVFVFRGHGDSVLTVRWCEAGRALISGSKDKTIRIWDTRAGRQRLTLEKHFGSVYSVRVIPETNNVVSNNMKLSSTEAPAFASAGRDSMINFWNANGDCISSHTAHRGYVSYLSEIAFSSFHFRPASASTPLLMLSIGSDSLIKIWDLKRCKCLSEINPLANNSNCVPPTASGSSSVTKTTWTGGNSFISASNSGMIRHFERGPTASNVGNLPQAVDSTLPFDTAPATLANSSASRNDWSAQDLQSHSSACTDLVAHNNTVACSSKSGKILRWDW